MNRARCVLCFFVALGTQAAAETVVYSDRAHPLQLGALTEVTLIYLDDVQRLETLLSAGLALDADKAQQQAINLLQSPRGQALQDELLDAYAGLAQAWSQGITQLPAVVVDGHVVYGQANVAAAVQAIENFRAARGGEQP